MNLFEIKWKELYAGWKNHLFPAEEMKEYLQELSNSRLDFCISCPHNSTPGEIKSKSRCQECGCFLLAKSKSLDSSCPIGKWNAVASPQEDDEFQKQLNGKQGT